MQQIKNFIHVSDGLEEYLSEQEKKWRAAKPFACPFLVVLPEPKGIVKENWPGLLENQVSEKNIRRGPAGH